MLKKLFYRLIGKPRDINCQLCNELFFDYELLEVERTLDGIGSLVVVVCEPCCAQIIEDMVNRYEKKIV